MAWRERSALDARVGFVASVLAGDEPMSAVCVRSGISRKTGCKWLARYHAEGAAGLAARASVARRHGRALAAEVVSLRERWPRWDPRKLRARFSVLHPGLVVPAASTIGNWLRREGLSAPQSRHRRTPPYGLPSAAVDAANDVWCADYKGWFTTGDGARCDPLTVTDAHSRALLCCEGVQAQDEASAHMVFERAFRAFGLPGAIRSDNGVPFATTGVGGLSRLSVWWLRLGIAVERIPPGCPQQNGRHERMHRTLKAETASPPCADLALQQARFDVFRREFNEERPHEALGQRVPASAYVVSSRRYPERLPEVEYGAEQAVRRVRSNGQIKWAGGMVFVGEALVGELVGVSETEHGDWLVRFAGVDLGYIDAPRQRLTRKPLGWRSRPVDALGRANALPTIPQAPQAPQ